MRRIMAVYDVDPLYAERFADFANEKEKVPFTVMAFTSLEQLKNYAAKNPVEILLINSAVRQEEVSELSVTQIVRLSDGEVVPVKEEYPSVYKYQAADSIIREVMACYGDGGEEAVYPGLVKKAELIGIYSPVNRCLKTSFALTMGQLMAKDQKVLYMNFEEYSGLTRIMGEEFKVDLSDLLYFYKQGSYNCIRLSSAVHSVGNLDYIPPARYSEDLSETSPEELADLILRIARESVYDVVLLDLGQLGRKSTEVLELCDIVYMPVKDDCMSAAKVEEFEAYLELSGRQSVIKKLYKLKLPYYNNFGRRENYLEQLLWGELGDYVRKLMKGRQSTWEQ